MYLQEEFRQKSQREQLRHDMRYVRQRDPECIMYYRQGYNNEGALLNTHHDYSFYTLA